MTTYEALEQKLDPRRFTAMSGKMAAIVGYILNTDRFRTEPAISGLTIDSSGGLLAAHWTPDGRPGLDDDFMGSADDLDDNWNRLLDVAGLTSEELALAQHLRRERIRDWRVQR